MIVNLGPTSKTSDLTRIKMLQGDLQNDPMNSQEERERETMATKLF